MQKLLKIIIISLFAHIFIINNVYAFENLKFNGFISDNANILTEGTESNLNNILHELQYKTKAEIAIVTLNDLARRLGKTQQKLSKVTFRNGYCINTIAILAILQIQYETKRVKKVTFGVV